ncbi:hypothetical protein PsorP6_001356 [Peronosclerospora sorghi]|uniref:Uncharacterized protein n=1 Tax=Peronosclerospora sorghi TaxID=230839 RepID=A0ACC0WU59_9STRA|nr:hypothetical protein PsorP6_001356 [Peronosclerospora sorghi]
MKALEEDVLEERLWLGGTEHIYIHGAEDPDRDGEVTESAPQVPTKEQIFSCWEDAESQYCSYAVTVGFEVRRHNTLNRANGECKRFDSVCNRHGFPDPEKTPEGSQPRQTPSTRTGCRAFIRVSRRDTAGANSE